MHTFWERRMSDLIKRCSSSVLPFAHFRRHKIIEDHQSAAGKINRYTFRLSLCESCKNCTSINITVYLMSSVMHCLTLLIVCASSLVTAPPRHIVTSTIYSSNSARHRAVTSQVVMITPSPPLANTALLHYCSIPGTRLKHAWLMVAADLTVLD